MRKDVLVTGAVVMTGASLIAATVVMMRQRKKRNDLQREKSIGILRKFAGETATPVPKLWCVADQLASSLVHDSPDLNVVVSYVAPMPTGEEHGWYYGVNLRGTSFLILSAQLRGEKQQMSYLNREEVPIPSSVMCGSSQELFDYIASELAEFIKRQDWCSEIISNQGDDEKSKTILGFTFTYPPDLAEACSSSTDAFKWKNFAFDDTEVKVYLEQINKALDKHGLNMKVLSLVDDTVGDLVSARYSSDDSIVAINLGNGINAAYVDHAIKADSSSPRSEEMVVNVDWGSFQSSHLPVSEYDESLDAESLNPGCRLISGRYIGEIVRKVLLKMAQETNLFGHRVPPKLACPNLLRPLDIAAMHQDTSEDREIIDDKLREIFNISNSSLMTRKLVAEVCDLVAERGARLAGAGIVGIMKKLERMDKKSMVVVQGGLYEHYRVYRNYLHSSVWEMLGNELSENVVIQPCHGGSGAGSLFLAACQSNQS